MDDSVAEGRDRGLGSAGAQGMGFEGSLGPHGARQRASDTVLRSNLIFKVDCVCT
jgi:hypothetical protein